MKRLTFLILFTVFLANVAAQSHDDQKPSAQEKAEFKKWMRKFHKKYGSKEEEETALMNWTGHKRHIDENNRQYRRGQKSSEMALHDHADLTHEEIKYRKTGVIHPDSERARKKMIRSDQPTFPTGPKSVDWRKQNLVGPVRYQRELY